MLSTAILWFRRDLRLGDNPALQAALNAHQRLVPVYLHSPDEEAPWVPGAASNWWLHHSLSALDEQLRARGSRLLILRVDKSLLGLRALMRASGAGAVFWNRVYEPASMARDTAIKQALRADGIRCESHNASFLFEPWDILTGVNQPFKVFTAYWRRGVSRLAEIPSPSAAPKTLPPVPTLTWLETTPVVPTTLEQLGLKPRIPWDAAFPQHWQPGASGAQARLQCFLDQAVSDYAVARDHPDRPGTSKLSAHLHFGEIGPRQILAALRSISTETEAFVRELGWREFNAQLLYHVPHTLDQPLNPKFADFPWRDPMPPDWVHAWQRGKTGIPLVDAGLRELWQTGWMHNRVRMVVASFLTKNLRFPWQLGARWFWETLVDADLANNTQGWQWTAGCGADAAPYFRVFNPVRQGERFDPEGRYVRQWCPELARLPQSLIHRPWTASVAVLQQSGLVLGQDYPLPIINLDQSRREALASWQQLRDADKDSALG